MMPSNHRNGVNRNSNRRKKKEKKKKRKNLADALSNGGNMSLHIDRPDRNGPDIANHRGPSHGADAGLFDDKKKKKKRLLLRGRYFISCFWRWGCISDHAVTVTEGDVT
jgi:hypothetical protein